MTRVRGKNGEGGKEQRRDTCLKELLTEVKLKGEYEPLSPRRALGWM